MKILKGDNIKYCMEMYDNYTPPKHKWIECSYGKIPVEAKEIDLSGGIFILHKYKELDSLEGAEFTICDDECGRYIPFKADIVIKVLEHISEGRELNYDPHFIDSIANHYPSEGTILINLWG